jgi:hypothetical protein
LLLEGGVIFLRQLRRFRRQVEMKLCIDCWGLGKIHRLPAKGQTTFSKQLDQVEGALLLLLTGILVLVNQKPLEGGEEMGVWCRRWVGRV